MPLDDQTVNTIAHLSRLEIAADDQEKYRNELSNILDLVAQMEACDTENIEPMTHPFDATLCLREDLVTEGNQRDKFQTVAPATDRGLYLVPKVID